jgi:hypothetical protein
MYILMARVAYNKADVVRPGKLDCGLDIGSAGDVDGILHVVAELARRRPRRKGVTALVGKE